MPISIRISSRSAASPVKNEDTTFFKRVMRERVLSKYSAYARGEEIGRTHGICKAICGEGLMGKEEGLRKKGEGGD